MEYESYAIWWVPRPGSALAQFGAAWTGWCADRGVVTPAPADLAAAGAPRNMPGWLGRRGLHASVSSAFRLASGRSCWALEDALADLTERTDAVMLPPLELTVFDGRVALALARPDAAVALLSKTVAEAVRPFALPLPFGAFEDGGAEDPGSGDRGGHAATLERFHLPLTDRLDLGRAYEVVAGLRSRLAPVLAPSQRVEDLAFVGDPGGGRPWRLLQRHALAGETARRQSRVPSGMAWRGPSMLAPLSGAGRGPSNA
jgi:hypothetical protein